MTHPGIPLWLIFGGKSPEHPISVSSAQTAAANIDRSKFAVKPVYIRRDGLWNISGPVLRKEDNIVGVFSDLMSGAETCDAGTALSAAEADEVAAALLILHGAWGEDGTIQGMLEMADLSYTGSGVLASSLAMDKVRCQRFLGACGLPVSPLVHEEDAVREGTHLAEAALETIGMPCVVKPSRAGSSVGISIVEDERDLKRAIEVAAQIDPLVMVEKFIPGEEVTCGVIEACKEGRVERQAMPVTAIRPKNSQFFDFRAKYTAGECEEITPAPIPDSVRDQIQALSLKTFAALGCRDMARIDFILDPESGPVLLEVNTIPGLTPTSLLPQQAAHVGISFRNLLEIFLQNAIARGGVIRSED